MALDREKAFSNAERLMKQGKTSLALEECRRGQIVARTGQ